MESNKENLNLGIAEKKTTTGWKNPSYLALLIAQFISMLGGQLSWVALPWFVLETTGSPGKMTIVLFAQAVPIALLGIPAGMLVDRVHKKRLMMFCDFTRGLLTVAVPILAGLGYLQFWMLIVYGVLQNALLAPFMGARMAMIPALVGDDEEELTRANTAFQFTFTLTSILGPALAGILIGQIGEINVLYLDGATFFVSLALIGFGMRYMHKPLQEASEKNPLQDILAGIKFMWDNIVMRVVVGIGIVASLGFAILFSAALPVYVRNTLGGDAQTWGWLMSAEGIGSVIGMLTYGALATRLKIGRGMRISLFTIGMVVPIYLLPIIPSFWAALVGLSISALFTTPIVIIVNTMLQTDSPKEIHGRVFSAFNALWSLATPAGLLVAGPLLEQFGALPVVWLVCGILTLCVVFAWITPTRHA